MTNKEITLELKENKVDDNPFDVMLHFSIEITRDLLFACQRLKNPEVPEHVCTNLDRLESYMNKITREFEKLLNMSEETVAMCRETSFYYQEDNLDRMNESLLKFDKDLPTVWGQCVPSRNDRFEQLRLGKDSDAYKRLLELRKIVTESELSCVNVGYLYSLCDIIDEPSECLQYRWLTEDELEERRKIIEKYKLTEDEIQYMISYQKQIKQ